MTTNNFDAVKEIEKLSIQTEEKKAEILLKSDVLQKTGLNEKDVIIYAKNKIGFGWYTPLSKEQVKKVISAYPINGKNYEIKFASSAKNFVTDSSLVVNWENSHSYKHLKVFKLQYESNGIEISITVPASHFGSHVYYRSFQGKHRGFGKYEMYNDMYLNYFYTQSYSGGYNTCYFLEGAEKIEEYENWVITGEFKYSDEL